MLRKLLILSLCISVLFVFSALIPPVNAGSKNVNWQAAGSIANYVQVLDTNTYQVVPNYLISLSAKGPPGNAEITLMGVGEFVGPDPACNGENRINITQNEMVARFSDLSLLFAIHASTPDSYLCSTAVGTTFNIHMMVTGGTGRFEGVTGNINGSGFGYPLNPDPDSYGPDGPLSAETANITGTIDLP